MAAKNSPNKNTPKSTKTASKPAQAGNTPPAKPATPKKSAFSKETIPFVWKIVAKSGGLNVVLSKHTDQETAEKEFQRLKEGQLYDELNLYPIDKVIIQPKSMRNLPWNPAAEKKAKAAAAKAKAKEKVKAREKAKAKAKAKARAKAKAKAKATAKAKKKPAVKKPAKPAKKSVSPPRKSTSKKATPPIKKAAKTKKAAKSKKSAKTKTKAKARSTAKKKKK